MPKKKLPKINVISGGNPGVTGLRSLNKASRGKLGKVCDLGGLSCPHSNELYDLVLEVCNKSELNSGTNHGYLDVAIPSTN